MGTRRDKQQEVGPKGEGELRVLKGEGDEEFKLKLINAAGIVVGEFSPDACLTALPADIAPRKVYGPIFYKLSGDEQAIYELRPWGTAREDKFLCRFKRLPSRDGEEPTHYTAEARDIMWLNPKTNKRVPLHFPELEKFNSLLEVVTGKFKGMELKCTLAYFFEEDPDDGTTYITGKGKEYDLLESFMTQAGYDWNSDSMEYTPNVLPQLDVILQSVADENVFEVRIKKGWPKEFTSIPEGMVIAE